MIKQTAPSNFNPESRLNGLDHLRSLAIILVFMYHAGRLFPHPQWTQAISNFGWTGVDLFFVLSGYLIASHLFSEIVNNGKISCSKFFIKRFFRIIPAYLVVVALYFSFPSIHERESLAPLWKYLTFSQNLGLDLRSQGTFSHAWSLCVEEQFYLFMPLVLILLVKFNWIKKAYLLLVFLFLFGFIIRLCIWNSLVLPFADRPDGWSYWYKWIYYPTFCRLDGLLVGVSIAALLAFLPNFKQKILKYGNHLLIISIFILLCASVLCQELDSFRTSIFGFPLVAVGYGLMVIGAISPNSLLFRFQSKITAKLAALSYGIYLSHKFIIHLSQGVFSNFNIAKESNSMFLLSILTCILAAVALNLLIEKPFLWLRDWILNHKMNKY